MRAWMIYRRLIAMLVCLLTAGAAAPFEQAAFVTSKSAIDQLVFGQLQRLKIAPAQPCSDAVFLRRVYLDVIGTLPTAEEAEAFLSDGDPAKRRVLIDRLLEREEFADYWSMKWAEVLRIKSEFPINLWPNATQAYHQWIRSQLRQNTPYDRLARELLTASGSNFRVPPANFYRAVQSRTPPGLAGTVALSFMGQRVERWPAERLAGFSAFFAQVGYKSTAEWKEEIVFHDPSKGQDTQPVFPDGTPAKVAPGQDPRQVLADWLVSPNNPYFARAVANRIWFWLMGRGIVHEPDDLREDNPPVHPQLLAYLERELIAHRYDLKHLYRLILNSRAYQLSSIPGSEDPRAVANFAFYPMRRLEAEVLIDAINQITGTAERYSSAIPEPFTFVPDDVRAIALHDGSITSTFLELFGRPARDTGLLLERNIRPTADQKLHLLNSTHIQRKLEQSGPLRKLMQSRDQRQIITNLYLAILSRYPTEPEIRTAQQYAASGAAKDREVWIDLAWALLNSSEFLYRH